MARVGVTNTELAHGLGVSERQITNWRGGATPRYRFLERIARYFGREPEWFYVDRSDSEQAPAIALTQDGRRGERRDRRAA